MSLTGFELWISEAGSNSSTNSATITDIKVYSKFSLSINDVIPLSVIKRLVSLIATNAMLEAEREAAMKQAQSASRAAETLMAGDTVKASDKEKELEKKLKAAEAGWFYLVT